MADVLAIKVYIKYVLVLKKKKQKSLYLKNFDPKSNCMLKWINFFKQCPLFNTTTLIGKL